MEDYIRNAVVAKIQDGDTLLVWVDLGFKVMHEIELRLLDVYAYEIKGKEKELGMIDKKKLQKLLPINTPVTIQTFKTRTGKDKKSFTRYIAKVWKGEVLINDLLKIK